ncbi:MAG: hypothetical protein GC168_08180 [Candidatus Hydrogenedens sp.]|nr:hypothetical protein [Candidatus Hydrogenedens sp.]
MQDERAYTHVDHTSVLLGNRWLEREWSAFMGHTVRLIHKPGNVEWLTENSPELRLACGGDVLGLMDLGAVEWSEEQSPQGASVVSRQTSDSFVVAVKTMALHDEPALFRRVTIMNRTRAEITLDAAAVELLPVELAVCTGAEAVLPASPWELATGFSVQRAGRHLVAACEQGLTSELNEDDGLVLRTAEPITVPPGKTAALPEVLMMLGPGSPQQSLAANYPAASNAVRAWKRWAAERGEA